MGSPRDNTDHAWPRKCDTCEADLRSPIVCQGCQTIFPLPVAADYFQLLGLPRGYEIDAVQLQSSYRTLARLVHPDRFSNEPPEAAALPTRLSAALNDAVRVLSDPVRRADYLLTLSGGPDATTMRDVPGQLLAEVMMLREEIDDARSSGDDATLARLRRTIQEKRTETMTQIGHSARTLPVAAAEEKKQLRLLINAIKYWDNLTAELAENPLSLTTGSQHD